MGTSPGRGSLVLRLPCHKTWASRLAVALSCWSCPVTRRGQVAWPWLSRVEVALSQDVGKSPGRGSLVLRLPCHKTWARRQAVALSCWSCPVTRRGHVARPWLSRVEVALSQDVGKSPGRGSLVLELPCHKTWASRQVVALSCWSCPVTRRGQVARPWLSSH